MAVNRQRRNGLFPRMEASVMQANANVNVLVSLIPLKFGDSLLLLFV